ncbi:hypothetical protein FJZ23_00315 [Candidatus Parcubacteria bacterium]|nr:hypothetical protein [Candidatus Parcubacteria bacterium]
MPHRFASFSTIAIYTFVAWVIVQFIFSFALSLPRGAFIAVHYLAVILAFALIFRAYFDVHPNADAFDTTAQAILVMLIFEGIFLAFYASDPLRFLNYTDWIVPTFLTACAIYFVGKPSTANIA